MRLHLTPFERERFHALTHLRVCMACRSVHILADFDLDGNCRPRTLVQVEAARRFVAQARGRIIRLGSQPDLTRRGV